MPNPRDIDVRFSRLKHMAQSPAHYRYAIEHDDDTPAKLFGRVVHSLVLGGGSEVVVYDGKRQGNAWKEFKAANDGKELLTATEYDRARACADSVLRDPVAAPYLVGRKEISLYWENCGRKCSSRIDVIGAGFITELKTCFTTHPTMFSRQALRMHYPGQVAWYQDAAKAIGKVCPVGIVIGVESKPPYVVTVLNIPQHSLENGRKQSRLWLEQLLACEAADVWPGYVQSVVDLEDNDGEDFLTFADDEEAA